MNPLVQYYFRQAGRGVRGDNGIGPMYSVPHFVQRGYCIGSFLSGLIRTVRHILWSGAKSWDVRRSGLWDARCYAQGVNPQVSSHDIISKHVGESTQNIIKKLLGG
jgi:hypothetical protein